MGNEKHDTFMNSRSPIGQLFMLAVWLIALSSCNTDPQPIVFGKDYCDFCKMTIMDKKFGAELVNKKGKAIKFDSGECMVNYMHADKTFEVEKMLTVNYANPEELIEAEKAFFIRGGTIKSPMGGQLAAFKTIEEAEKFQQELGGDLLSWIDVAQINF